MKYYPVHAGYPPYAEVNPAIEAAFAEHGRGNVQMPPKVYVTFVESGDFRTMPAYLPAQEIAGVKIVNVHPHNRTRGLPTVMALTVIIDITTGIPTAIINATELTALRTGSAGAIAAKYLAPRHPVTLGIVGAGRQAEAQVEATAASLAIEEILVWSRTEKSAEAFAARYSDYNARSVPIERACDCDVLTTTTPSTKPVVMADWIHEGTHINAIGADAPGKQELDPTILENAEVFVDDPGQATHSGEVNVPVGTGYYDPARIAGTLGEVVIGKKGRSSPDAITIFDSTGLAIQDLAIAALVLRDGDGGYELPFP
ncbi:MULTISPECIES: ornithine cyclodeaminase family protein [Methanoculleus]|uniref:Alanine dehydrogenase n=2 Tax=Methanoculleus TaxID=45989 RepID=A3CU87_METMJ|nr:MULTISPECIES: NAD(P)-binding domain-containing protein [Methanoculleus]ABN56937.1 L-alanine dehydrogenase [Methanoculleus marisnigri JR1]MCC7555921.1 NAD(P)-binding domain-containing protein [Methanoculleus marisnigri]UYU18360.1 NAD(P)-binding domain-containing protein [Methanoculleus submarinus]